ncbi:uncharacterized protein CLUP02_00369 [Colletotrichum lupini]|uniref:Uncharacterized protein n=1 Tax=Colletotrichum lupini TaxID=145971 RepID=A0A9Q8SAY4_9PEZI|nr:uncharacterized protein CLUP02_00369 [Colletotrichum lupini]UQC73723.1 hypothetical protein CLUP02_00369 [Colletotrichum lupini]
MQCPPAVRPSRPSRHPTEFLTASLLPPPNDSRAPSPTSSNPGPTCAGRPCRFGPGVSETTPVQCHARAVIGGVALERNTSTVVRVRQSRLKAQATQGRSLSHFEPQLRHAFQRINVHAPPWDPFPCHAGMIARSHSFSRGFQGVVRALLSICHPIHR